MTTDEQIHALERKIEQLANQLGILEDTHAIRRLQHAYGYYLDKCLCDQVVDLFSKEAEVHFLGGIFHGKKGAHRLYCDRFRAAFTGGKNGPVYGFLLDHPVMQDIVDVQPDRTLAKGRFRCFMQAGRHESSGQPARQWWEGGLYENTYIKEDGVWKIKTLNYHPIWHADYETGWAHTKPEYVAFYSATYPDDPIGPDELEAAKPVLWPEMDVLAFHYPHPVTGKWDDAKGESAGN